ncbi:uncharacterized protein BJ212DRAFT_1448663 [Suillus subaureus]|uniref:Uncharacterized protein n=1 Tax=Suillus subaureus TaxID=48587 RepID=A0A9P7E434_9AGAM|nr:uncharacterized protein BJ212DRAFT_1448663 [Suillus subaureus]KAG1810629.1 hypothetical protein BJ212DRAFT_1448663 [Suillus subaureus]
MVGAFHGHAHNQCYQLDWHPMYIDGTGHTEGEGCKHVFASSNELVQSTRHTSAFHQHQTIEEHFAFWDDDKYATLMLTSIKTLTAELSILKDTLGLTNADFIQFHSQERLYLDNLKEPPLKEILHICYVQVLHELAKSEWDLACKAANQALTTIAAEALTAHMEIQLGIEEHWEIGGDTYNQYEQEASQCQYCTALDDLEQLVVMRLFELSKLSLSGMGVHLTFHLLMWRY